MDKRIPGRTGFNVLSVGIGGIPIQRVDKDLTIEILRGALSKGLNFIDTARGYGESEELIGQALEILGRENFIIATKSMARTYDKITEDFNTSLKLLKTGYIDLYQFHNVRTMKDLEVVLRENGALKAIKEFKEKGLVKEIGISSHSKDVLNIAIYTEEFSTIQFHIMQLKDKVKLFSKMQKEKTLE